MTIRGKILKVHPAILVLTSFLLAILLGALALKLPVCTKTGGISLVDALFTATSAVCVTGLVVVDTGSYFTFLGQCVILALIQIGGLGVMTISIALFQWLGKSVSFRHRRVMQDLFAHTPRADIFGLVKSVFLFTLAVELTGAVLLTIHWWQELGFTLAVYNGIFHSISAFCNAGFALFPDSMMRYGDNLLLNTTICCLIVAGGIGFPVLYDLQSWLVQRKKKRMRLSIQTKTVLVTTLVLIVFGALLFAILEQRYLGEAQSLSYRLLVPVFQSITCRTAGFNTVDIASLQDATLAMMIFLMFFGASPGSCGGGVKTTTLALLTVFTVSRIRKARRVNIFRKSLPNETVTRSVSLILVSFGVIAAVLFMLLIGDAAAVHQMTGGHGVFLAYLFETVSAFGTVGLSMGVTPELNAWGKCWIILMMIIGRVGVLTFSYIIVGAGPTKGLEYSEENMMVG
ncbi:MAG: TrkH family potassium uptake protein [Proteobacteria bacterium]|nr:TrkH family potassium uptake protein [Pseudomonadota bacterium]MBU4297958.1 TrkH family potassium uptake protein [Pseudomonadota bacterium]MCG2749207.1 TrkH family potassium uptake protein [Desulfobulbaceae bacterium]